MVSLVTLGLSPEQRLCNLSKEGNKQRVRHLPQKGPTVIFSRGSFFLSTLPVDAPMI